MTIDEEYNQNGYLKNSWGEDVGYEDPHQSGLPLDNISGINQLLNKYSIDGYYGNVVSPDNSERNQRDIFANILDTKDDRIYKEKDDIDSMLWRLGESFRLPNGDFVNASEEDINGSMLSTLLLSNTNVPPNLFIVGRDAVLDSKKKEESKKDEDALSHRYDVNIEKNKKGIVDMPPVKTVKKAVSKVASKNKWDTQTYDEDSYSFGKPFNIGDQSVYDKRHKEEKLLKSGLFRKPEVDKIISIEEALIKKGHNPRVASFITALHLSEVGLSGDGNQDVIKEKIMKEARSLYPNSEISRLQYMRDRTKELVRNKDIWHSNFGAIQVNAGDLIDAVERFKLKDIEKMWSSDRIEALDASIRYIEKRHPLSFSLINKPKKTKEDMFKISRLLGTEFASMEYSKWTKLKDKKGRRFNMQKPENYKRFTMLAFT